MSGAVVERNGPWSRFSREAVWLSHVHQCLIAPAEFCKRQQCLMTTVRLDFNVPPENRVLIVRCKCLCCLVSAVNGAGEVRAPFSVACSAGLSSPCCGFLLNCSSLDEHETFPDSIVCKAGCSGIATTTRMVGIRNTHLLPHKKGRPLMRS